MTTPKTKGRIVCVRRAAGTEHFTEEQFAMYWRILCWPALVTFMVILWAQSSYPGFDIWREYALLGMMFIVLTVVTLQRYQRVFPEALIVNGLAGIIMGFVLALLALVNTFSFYRLFSLLTTPVWITLLGVGVGVLTYTLYRKLGARAERALSFFL